MTDLLRTDAGRATDGYIAVDAQPPRTDSPGFAEPTLYSALPYAAICILTFIVCVFAAYPISKEGYLDDFSSAHSALIFAQTGHFVYNGWLAPLLGWLVAWGALFIKLFGFSFLVLRVAVLPIAIGTVYLFYWILIRSGITLLNALFGTLALALSPLVFPVSLSFMTDLSGLFALLICAAMCYRAVFARSNRSAILWLISAALLNSFAGTVRQNAWLGALVMVPCAGYLLRNRRGALISSLASAAVSLACMKQLYEWFSHRPYFFMDPAPTHLLHHTFRTLAASMTKLCLCTLLLLVPVLSAWWSKTAKLGRGAMTRVAVVAGVCGAALGLLAQHGKLDGWLAPWLPCTLTRFGSFNIGQVDQLVASSATYPMWLRVVLTFVTIAGTWIVMEQGWDLYRSKRIAPLNYSQRAFLWILGPASFCYLLLLSPRASSVGLLDRYAIFILPFAIGFLLMMYQHSLGKAVPVISFVVLVIFALDAVGDSHDYYADQRAGDAAVQQLVDAGIPRTSISQSMNSDAWVQVSLKGYILQPNVLPDQDNAPSRTRKPRTVSCSTYMENRARVVKPEYYVVFSPSACLQPGPYPPVTYISWLPPFRRQQYIEQPK